jgi:hypothetical protein
MRAGAAVLVAGALPTRRLRRELHSADQADPAGFGRYRLVYDASRPRPRLGVLWFVAALGAIALGTGAVAVLYGAVAAVAGLQTAYAWRRGRPRPLRPAAALIALVLPLVAVAGARPLGAAILVMVALTVAVALSRPGRLLAGVRTSPPSRHPAPGAASGPAASDPAAAGVDRPSVGASPSDRSDRPARRPTGAIAAASPLAPGGPVDAAAASLRCGLFVGLAAASIVLVRGADAGAALAVLLLVSAYEAGDYLVGTGSTTAVEGPVAGIIGALVVTFALALFPPSAGHGTVSMWLLGAATALGCPLGQLAGSVLLPSGGSFAPALRRLDSLLVVGPLWAVVILKWWT